MKDQLRRVVNAARMFKYEISGFIPGLVIVAFGMVALMRYTPAQADYIEIRLSQTEYIWVSECTKYSVDPSPAVAVNNCREKAILLRSLKVEPR